MALSKTDKLRMLLGERIPQGGAATDTFFSDIELAELLDVTDDRINQAAFLGWAAKAGEYARMIDINESGGSRLLSQRYRQANTQMKFFQGLADQDIKDATSQGRAAPKSFSIGNGSNNTKLVLWTKRYNRMPVFDAIALVNPEGVVQYEETYSDR